MQQGIDQAWELLQSRDPLEVSKNAAVTYSASDLRYEVPVLGHTVIVDPAQRTLEGSSPESVFLLTRLAYFSRLSVLHYLLGAKPIGPTGRLLKPEELKSGQMYLTGSHLLPTRQLAACYSGDVEDYRAQAARLGGEVRPYGDVAVELYPFPRVPVTLILWEEDDEFPADSHLLLDETCESHLPPDIVWSVAMLCVLAMLRC